MEWLHQEDPEVLRAALDILDEWGGGLDVSDATTSSSGGDSDASAPKEAEELSESSDDTVAERGETPSTDASAAHPVAGAVQIHKTSTRQLKPSTLMSTRHRRREEIIYLRTKVGELEQQLASLHDQAQREREKAADACADAIAVMWRDMADRQLMLRQRVEDEQAKLKRQLETQVQVAQGLVKVLQKARRIEDEADYPVAKRSKVVIDVSSHSSVDEQIQRLPKLFVARQDAFAFPRFQDGTLKFFDVNVAYGGTGTCVVLEVREAWTLPFAWARVLDVLWVFQVNKSHKEVCKFTQQQTVTRDDDIIVSGFLATGTIPLVEGPSYGRLVAQLFRSDRFEDAGIVQTMSVRPKYQPEDGSEGPRLYEDAWIRVLDANVSDRVGSYTTVQSITRLSIVLNSNEAASASVGALTECMMNLIKQEIELRHEVVETLLLDSR